MQTSEYFLQEDARRRAARRGAAYDPLTGEGCCGERRRTPLSFVPVAPDAPRECFLPAAMLDDPEYPRASFSEPLWKQLRMRHDFEYWCRMCVTIKDKTSGLLVPFVLNAPQRKVLALLEADRTALRPIRMIVLKARQWGGSTLVQIYMAWIQICHRRNWNSLICAHVKDTAATIRGIYSRLLDNYPSDLWDDAEKPEFKPFERSVNIRRIAGRDCTVTIGTSENQDAVRGSDYSMAHLSETAFWASTQQRSPEGFIRAVCGAIALIPYSLVVVESTANGVGNYFHTEWLRCRDGRGDKHAVFVAWHEIEIYRLDPPDPAAFALSFNAYERRLWDMGLCLDQIYWYRCKRAEYASARQMAAEFPTDDTEAFANTGSGVFANEAVERLRASCRPPLRIGAVRADGRAFSDDSTGRTHLWEMPAPQKSYVVAVDVGGRSAAADWSVIAVLTAGPRPEVVAQWRGHVDHDLLAREAARIGRFYNNALLVVESNTFETAEYGGAADSNLFILNRLAEAYPNIYRRRRYDVVSGTETTAVGFHTNRATKAMLVTGLIEAVRDGLYIERCADACNELLTYEQLPNGTYAARQGCHDDILMTRAIALRVLADDPLPAIPRRFPQLPSW